MEAKYNALIEIRVPKTDGTECIGTGYPVAKNRILTARHILHPEYRDENKPIVLRWYYKKNSKANEFRQIKSIAWEGKGEELDVAVLDCTFPEDAQNFLRLARVKPSAHANWDSKGFAHAAPSRDWEREPVGLLGKTHGMADTAWRFEVDVDTPPDIPNGWAGSSGFPVFVEDQILGVGTVTLANFGQKKLTAVAIWRLLDDFEDFCRVVNVSSRIERETWRETYREKIAAELRQTPEARDQLERLARVPTRGCGDSAERMARALVDLPDIETCRALYKVFLANVQAKRHDVALVISRIANLALPAVLDEEDAIKVRDRDEGTVVALRCYTRTLAELIMAKCDGREAKFRPPTVNEKWLRGVHEICSEPESGIHHKAADDIKNFNMLLQKLCLDIDEMETFGEEDKLSELKLRIKIISEEATKYFVFRPSDYTINIELMPRVDSINRLYPEIAFLLLSKPTECKNRDTTLLFGNERMLVYSGDNV